MPPCNRDSVDVLESPTVDKRTLAICLTNRAQCHIRLEEFGISHVSNCQADDLFRHSD